jgi:penicillin-binding protein-related factor A (putative recombinase)
MSKSNSGKELERAVKRSCAAYLLSDVAKVEKVDPPTVVRGGKILMLASPWLDFHGTAIGGGSVVLEVKDTKVGRLALGAGGLTEKQWDSMQSWHAWGAMVGLLWRFDGEVRLLTVPQISAALEGRRSVPWAYTDHQVGNVCTIVEPDLIVPTSGDTWWPDWMPELVDLCCKDAALEDEWPS